MQKEVMLMSLFNRAITSETMSLQRAIKSPRSALELETTMKSSILEVQITAPASSSRADPVHLRLIEGNHRSRGGPSLSLIATWSRMWPNATHTQSTTRRKQVLRVTCPQRGWAWSRGWSWRATNSSRHPLWRIREVSATLVREGTSISTRTQASDTQAIRSFQRLVECVGAWRVQFRSTVKLHSRPNSSKMKTTGIRVTGSWMWVCFPLATSRSSRSHTSWMRWTRSIPSRVHH